MPTEQKKKYLKTQCPDPLETTYFSHLSFGQSGKLESDKALINNLEKKNELGNFSIFLNT